MKKLLIPLLITGVCLAGVGIDRLNEDTQLPFWKINILSGDPNEMEEYMRVLIESLQDLTDDIITDLNQLTSVESGITAEPSGVQGDQPLTRAINEIDTIATALDSVTLPEATLGRRCTVINNGDYTLRIYPASGDNAGEGVDTAITLSTHTSTELVSYDATNWESFGNVPVDLDHSAIYGNAIGWSQSNAVQNTWYNIVDSDITDSDVHGIVHDGNGRLTVAAEGHYFINYTACMEVDAANDHVAVGIELNGSGAAVAAGQAHNETKFANQEFHLSGTTILDLSIGDYIEIAMRTMDGSTPKISVDSINIVMYQMSK